MQVYLISNLVNGKYYVGKTVSRNLRRYIVTQKFWAATSEKGRKCWQNMPIIAALRKYGIENFSVDVLAYAADNEQLSLLERLWIVALDSRNPLVGYNISAGGEGIRVPMTEDRKRKIGIANKGRKPKGYVRTEAHSKQLRDRMQGNRHGKGRGRGHFVSEAEREKHRAFALEQWRLRKEGA